MKCPNCQSIEIRKHGFYREKQRYQCKLCARQFIETYRPKSDHQSSTGVEDRINQYIASISTPANDLLVDLHQATKDYPLSQMQPTLQQAQAIMLLMQAIGASRVLELGIFSSYSTLAMALALSPSGSLISSGVAGKHLDIARYHWRRSDVNDKIDFQVGSGLELLDRLLADNLAASFDLIVIAGLKHQYPLYYQRVIELLRPQGLLVTTDVFWQGRVLNPDLNSDEFTKGIESFNRTLVADHRMNVSVLPIGDGLSIAVKH
jgi:predicted O-methyltransferase YrrM